MDEPRETVRNSAEGSASVGIQAQEVHNSTVYQMLPDTPPERKYRIGVRYLDDGVPVKARELINDAIAHGHQSSEVRFHWLLAMLSKRSYRQLNREERAQIRDVRGEAMSGDADDWTRATQVVYGLLDCHEQPGTDPGQALKELDALGAGVRKAIIRHLALILTGSMKDRTWAETYEAAEKGRTAADRSDRVWAYFYPDPEGARVLPTQPASTSASDWLITGSATAVFVVAAAFLGWAAVVGGSVSAILAYAIACAAGCLAAWAGLERSHRRERLRALDREYIDDHRVRRAPPGGFANKVDRLFDRYFWKYSPRTADQQTWLSETKGIRNSMRDEVAHLYRDSRVRDQQISWLIRFMVTDVRRRWLAGELLEHRERFRISARTKVAYYLGLILLAISGLYVAIAAVVTHPLTGTLAIAAALPAGRIAARQWVNMHVDKSRYADEVARRGREQDERHAAYLRWKEKLAAHRPSEAEMETWLECDRTILLDLAMKRYRLAWRDVIAYAFLQSRPRKGYKRARDANGPWRYSKYTLRLYLLTADGVREMESDLDFEWARFDGEKRASYRFDAVASVGVDRKTDSHQTLELLLVNGPPQTIPITDDTSNLIQNEGNSSKADELTLDAAGFEYALHILEGIAAEGKHWIDRRPDDLDQPAPAH